MAVTRKRFFPHTVTIDGQPVRLKLTRMTVPEFEEFQAKFIAMGQGRGAPVLETAAGDLSPITREQLDAHAAYLVANAEWLQSVFERFVRVVDGDLLDEDDEGQSVAVTSGKQFADMFGGTSVPAQVLARIYIENKLTDEQKKTLQSLSGSEIGFTPEPVSAAVGERPDPTAASAAPEASASNGDAMAPLSAMSSGTTVQ